MAVDTAAKRFSIASHGCPWRSLLPPPDGSNTEGDRLHGLYLYSGIATPSFTGTFQATAPRLFAAGTAQRIKSQGTAPQLRAYGTAPKP